MRLEELTKKLDALQPGERLAVDGVPDHVYHAAPGIGSTLMKAASKSMAHFKAARDNVSEPTPQQQAAYDVGNALHTLVLEPDLFLDRFVVQPEDIPRRAGKKWELFKAQNADKTILSVSQLATAGAMADSVYDTCGRFFQGGEAEKSYWFKHPGGLLLKARIDYQAGDAIVDLKSTKHDTGEQFLRAVKYDYDQQDALYRYVSGLPDMIYVGVGKLAPYPPFLAKQGAAVREMAEARLESTIQDLIFAHEFNEFPGVAPELYETELKPWEITA